MACNGCSNGCDDCGGLTCGEGTAGTDGLNSFTVTTASFVQPAIGANVTINVSALGQATGIWAQVGQVIYVVGGGYYEVVSVTATTIVAENLGYTGNTAPAATIAFPAGVSPGGVSGPAGAFTVGADGVNGTTILGYERDGGDFTSLAYTQIRGPYAIPANSWEAIGDTVRVKLLVGGYAGGTLTDHINYYFKMKVGGVNVVIDPFTPGPEYPVSSHVQDANGALIEVDLVAKSFSPFVLEAVSSGSGSGLMTLGKFQFNPGSAGLFTTTPTTIPPSVVKGMYFGPSALSTTGIDPTVSNDFTVEAKHVVVGTGGAFSSGFFCPFSLIELLKKN